MKLLYFTLLLKYRFLYAFFFANKKTYLMSYNLLKTSFLTKLKNISQSNLEFI